MGKNIELQTAFQELWNVIKKMTSQLETFHKKRNELQAQIDFLDNAITLKNTQINELERKNIDLQHAINEKNERINKQYSEIDSLLLKQEKANRLEDLYSNVATENDILKKNLTTLTDKSIRSDELKKEYDELQIIKGTLEKENWELSEKVVILDNTLQNNKIAQNELKNVRLEIINRNDQINKLKINISEQESVIISKNNELKRLLSDKTNLNNEISGLRTEMTKLNLHFKTIEEGFLQKEIALENDKLSYLAIIEHVKQEMLNYDKQKQILERTFAANKESDANLLKLQDDNKILQQELTEIKTHNKTLYAEIDTLKQQILTYDADFTEDRANKDNEVKEMLAETKHLTEIISELTEELENNKAGAEHIYLENKELVLKVNTLQGEINKAEKLSKAIEKMKQTGKEQASTILELQTELRSYKQRMYDEDSLFADMHKLEFIDNSKQHKLEIDKLVQRNTELENENSELLKRVNELKHKELEPIKASKTEEQPVSNARVDISGKEEMVSKISSFLEKLEQRL